VTADEKMKNKAINEKVFERFPMLQTERLVLRQVYLRDAAPQYRFRSDPAAMKYMARPLASRIGEVEALILQTQKAFEDKEAVYWALSLKPDDLFVGTAGFWRMKKEDLRAELGCQLLVEHQQKGYMTEALKAIIRFGFETLNLHSIEADSDPRNTASIRLLEKLGFKREALFRENVYFDGEFLDSAIYSLLRKE
jgi:ribosomal-protein-alanine N-acetyltransferase